VRKFLALFLCCSLFFGVVLPEKKEELDPEDLSYIVAGVGGGFFFATVTDDVIEPWLAIVGSLGAAACGAASSWFFLHALEKYKKIDLSSWSKKKRYLLYAVVMTLATAVFGGLGYWLLERKTQSGLMRRARKNLKSVKKICFRLGRPWEIRTWDQEDECHDAAREIESLLEDAREFVRLAQTVPTGGTPFISAEVELECRGLTREFERFDRVVELYRGADFTRGVRAQDGTTTNVHVPERAEWV